MMRIANFTAFALAALMAAVTGTVALAQDPLSGLETIGKPVPGAMGFQPAATELARDVHWLDGMLVIVIFAVTIFVLLLLAWVVVRFNKRVNPTPATFSHHSVIEVIWTIGPILILIFVGAFSLPVLFKQLEIPDADVTIKVTGNQWYWSYEYVDSEFAFDSFLLPREKLAANGYAPDEYLLATDAPVVVPVNKTVVMQITGSDVIHAWTIPAFGVKMDAVPGRLAEIWFKPEIEGIYFGQCSELCGKDHAFMPITVKVVSQANYARWLEGAIEKFAGKATALEVAEN